MILVQVRGRLHGQRIINDFWYRISLLTTTFDTNVDQAAVLAQFQMNFEAAILPLLSQDYTVEEYRCSCFHVDLLGNVTRFAFANILPTEVAGGVASASLPSTCAAIMKRIGTLAGPSHRGRIFVAGVPVASELESQLAPVVRAAWTTAALTLKEGIPSLGNWNLTPILKPGPDMVFFEDVNSTAIDTVLRVQRRREVGRGE
jgi:hypothetical protein